jgi:hypothetical protein
MIHVGFVVDRAALIQIFSPSSLLFPCQLFHHHHWGVWQSWSALTELQPQSVVGASCLTWHCCLVRIKNPHLLLKHNCMFCFCRISVHGKSDSNIPEDFGIWRCFYRCCRNKHRFLRFTSKTESDEVREMVGMHTTQIKITKFIEPKCFHMVISMLYSLSYWQHHYLNK